MRLLTFTAPSLFAGGSLFIGGLIALCMTSCANDPVQPSLPVEAVVAGDEQEANSSHAKVKDLGAVDFSADPFAAESAAFATQEPVTPTAQTEPEAEVEAVQEQSQEPTKEFFFGEDPMDDPDVEYVGNEADSLHKNSDGSARSKPPQSQLIELEAAPTLHYDEDFTQLTSQLNLAMLQARLVADELSNEAKVVVPAGIRTFGEVLPISFETRNPFGEPVELLPPSTGLLLELDWTVTRWLPLGASDRVQRHRYYLLNQWFLLESDQTFREFTDLPLQLEGDWGSVWTVEVDARIRCAGAIFAGKQLPVHSIEFAAARFLVLPPGWQQFEKNPLASLQRVLKVRTRQVDRHVLVCVALLRGDDRYRGVEVLLDGLRNAPNDGRRLTITQALQWLTGVQLGSLPADWLRWAELRKLSASPNGKDHEPTPGNPTSQ
jgi:hypothetical protein